MSDFSILGSYENPVDIEDGVYHLTNSLLQLNSDESDLIQLMQQINNMPLGPSESNSDDFTDQFHFPFRIALDPFTHQATRVLDTHSAPLEDNFWLELHPQQRILLAQERQEKLRIEEEGKRQIMLIEQAKKAETSQKPQEKLEKPNSAADSWAFLTKKRPNSASGPSYSNSSKFTVDYPTPTKRTRSFATDNLSTALGARASCPEELQIMLLKGILTMKFDENEQKMKNYCRPALVRTTIPKNQPFLLNEWPAFIKKRSFAYKVPPKQPKPGSSGANSPNSSSISTYPQHILYFLDSCLRLEQNLALQVAIWLSSRLNLPLLVLFFHIDHESAGKFEILQRLDAELQTINVPLLQISLQNPSESVNFFSSWCNSCSTHMIISDDSLTSPFFGLKQLISSKIHCSFHCIDNENFFPTRYLPQNANSPANFIELLQKYTETSNFPAILPFSTFNYAQFRPDPATQWPLYCLDTAALREISKFVAEKQPIDVVDHFSIENQRNSEENQQLFVPPAIRREFSVLENARISLNSSNFNVESEISAISKELIQISQENSLSREEIVGYLLRNDDFLARLLDFCANPAKFSVISPLRLLQLLHSQLVSDNLAQNDRIEGIWSYFYAALLVGREFALFEEYQRRKSTSSNNHNDNDNSSQDNSANTEFNLLGKIKEFLHKNLQLIIGANRGNSNDTASPSNLNQNTMADDNLLL
jgi:hypothetical protein